MLKIPILVNSGLKSVKGKYCIFYNFNIEFITLCYVLYFIMEYNKIHNDL